MAVPTRDRDISAHPPATAHHGSAAVPEPGHVLGRLVAPHGPRPLPPVPPPRRARHPRVAGWQPVGAASWAATAPCHPGLSPGEGKPSGGRPWPSHERCHQPPAKPLSWGARPLLALPVRMAKENRTQQSLSQMPVL